MEEQNLTMPPVIILCGGLGTRIRDASELLPKPMVPVGPQPIIWHIMKIYAAYGVRRFILCLGYKREAFIDYFLNYHARSADITVKLGPGRNIKYHNHTEEEDWEVTLADTGLYTQTGGRVGRAAKYLADTDQYCFMTYGDAVADLDLKVLYQSHVASGKLITVSAVHPVGRFGELNLDGPRVLGFDEKPQTVSGYINGGFMVLSREFLRRYVTEETDFCFEEAALKAALRNGEMQAFPHEGFWQCMDTAREHQLLNKMWDAGNAPWTKAW
ncbi:MAG: glucose-1-phosphate cytidylyltransferase [Victivallaceae bacterium]|nr:glucose-1-phosphate cytidylyltransferase [Victivallaceae bacterium]